MPDQLGHPQVYHLPACPLLARIKQINFRKTHMDPLEVVLVFQVNFSSEINRVNAIEDNGKRGAAPDKGDEEDGSLVAVLFINAHVDTYHLRAIVGINLPIFRKAYPHQNTDG